MGARFKMYDDRQFCNGHRTVTMGMPIGYLVSGEYSKEPNLQMILEQLFKKEIKFGIYQDEVLDFYEMIKMVYKIAEEENDFNVMAMLIDFMNKITIIVSQMYTLKDKAEQMPTDWDTFDNHISQWGINGLNLGE